VALGQVKSGEYSRRSTLSVIIVDIYSHTGIDCFVLPDGSFADSGGHFSSFDVSEGSQGRW
jgi:hypothetical protein